MGYDSKGILVFNLKYEHAISNINLVKFINYYQMPRSISSKLFVIASGGGEANVYGSSYYWNFRTSSFKQVACLILDWCQGKGVTARLSLWNILLATKNVCIKDTFWCKIVCVFTFHNCRILARKLAGILDSFINIKMTYYVNAIRMCLRCLCLRMTNQYYLLFVFMIFIAIRVDLLQSY